MSEKFYRGRRRFFCTAAMTVAAAQLGMTVLADARTTRKMVRHIANKSEPAEMNATVILVHGAWADGSSWARVIRPLQSRGLRTIAAPIPLTSLADDAAALERVLERTDGPVNRDCRSSHRQDDSGRARKASWHRLALVVFRKRPRSHRSQDRISLPRPLSSPRVVQ
jgi:hypothetical protein